jgi:hypothetical protein
VFAVPSGGSISVCTSTAPVVAFKPTSVCVAPAISATAYTRLVPGSYTMVLVMPSGSMSPQGRLASGSGDPTCVDQMTAPVLRLSA